MYPILDEIRSRVAGIQDRQPYSVDGQVVSEPNGFQWPAPVYGVPSSWPAMQGGLFGSLTRDDLNMIFLGMFFLLALAIVTRK